MIGTITIEGWQAITGIVTLLLIWGLKFLQEFYKDRRERETDTAQIQVLRDIAASNAEISKGQVAQNGKLSTVVLINQQHHEELIRTLQSTCKASCLNFQQKSKSD